MSDAEENPGETAPACSEVQPAPAPTAVPAAGTQSSIQPARVSSLSEEEQTQPVPPAPGPESHVDPTAAPASSALCEAQSALVAQHQEEASLAMVLADVPPPPASELDTAFDAPADEFTFGFMSLHGEEDRTYISRLDIEH